MDRFYIRFSDQERQCIEELCESEGRSVSAMVRLLAREALISRGVEEEKMGTQKFRSYQHRGAR